MALKLALTRYGRREIVVATVAAAAVCAALAWAAARVSPALWAALVVPVALWVWVVMFFRDPPRDVPAGEGLFVSPADGRVTDVTQLGADSRLGRAGVRVGIFMSIFDVHVNRSPCDARVESIEHQSGAFLDARNPAASERNESTTIRLRYRHGGAEHPVVVRQIVGVIARRIVTDIAEGQAVRRGQRIGMIKFGSRLELLVPDELVAQVRVTVGRRVLAGATVLIAAPRETNDG